MEDRDLREFWRIHRIARIDFRSYLWPKSGYRKPVFGFDVGTGLGLGVSGDRNGKDPYAIRNKGNVSCPPTGTTMYTGVKGRVEFGLGAVSAGRQGNIGGSANSEREIQGVISGELGIGTLLPALGLGEEGEAGWNNQSGGFRDGSFNLPLEQNQNRSPGFTLGYCASVSREYGFSW